MVKGYLAGLRDPREALLDLLCPGRSGEAGKWRARARGRGARRAIRSEEGWRFRKRWLPLLGERHDHRLRFANWNGTLIGFAKITRDLTERKRDELRLRQLAAENARLEARAEAERAQRVQREFLAKAGETLGSSLDYRATLANVARLAVPELADWCTIELVEPGSTSPVQMALAHVDPGKVEYARQLAEKYPPDPNAPAGVPQVIRSGKSELYMELSSALLEAGA